MGSWRLTLPGAANFIEWDTDSALISTWIWMDALKNKRRGSKSVSLDLHTHKRLHIGVAELCISMTQTLRLKISDDGKSNYWI